MRAMTCVAAALVLALATACDDRDGDETASRIDTTAGEVSAEAREGADDVRDAVDDAVDDATDGLGGESWDRRDEFSRDVRERLDALDRELAESERDLGEDASEARAEAVAAAREARRAVDRKLEQLGGATRETWDGLRREVAEALSAAELRVRELRPDAKPMGGTGGPS
jgi:acyl-CoA reductase-like NAD-dependent aldehyde dehydrogenase